MTPPGTSIHKIRVTPLDLALRLFRVIARPRGQALTPDLAQRPFSRGNLPRPIRAPAEHDQR
jgi:hypothetical protein